MIHYMTTIGVGGAWVGNELRILAREDIPFVLHSLNRPRSVNFTADDIRRMDRETRPVYPVSGLRVLAALASAPFRFGPRFGAAAWNALTGPREHARARLAGLWHLGVACHWAAGLAREDVRHIHSQWIHSGGTVAMYGAWLLDRPFSFTGHAADLFRDRAALTDKIARAAFIVCISDFHRRFYLDNGARPDQLITAHCGVDTLHFGPIPREREAGAPFRIVSVGRLVEKKGFAILIEAARHLKSTGAAFEIEIHGSGPLEEELRTAIATSEVGDCVQLTGQAVSQEDLPGVLADADAFCLPCVWAADNDVDGLPMVLMEAMAMQRPAVSTDLVGIPDLIIDGETGLLTPPGDARALAEALQKLSKDPALSARLAANGRAHVLADFNEQNCLDALVTRFRAALSSST